MWVEPHGNWGDGDLHLVELSAAYEGLDNIVAFWDPKDKPAPLEPYRFSYTLRWQSGGADFKLSENRVVSTRVGLDSQFPNARQFVMDFAGPKLDAVPENEPPLAIANCSTNAAIVDNFVIRNPFLNTWRVILKMQPKPGEHQPGGPPVHAAKGNQHLERDMDVSMESAVTGAAGQLAGRPLEEWNAAYVKVENYFHALRVRNKALLGQLVLRVLERAMRRAPAEPDRSATQARRRRNGPPGD